MKNIKWLTIAIITTICVTSVLHAQDEYIKAPREPRIIGYNKVDEQDEKEILNKLSSELKAELLKVKEVDKERYQDLLQEMSFSGYEMYGGFMETSEKERYQTDKQIEEMEVRTEALGVRYEHSTSENEKQKIISDLKSVLNQLFDLKEKSRSLEVEQLEKELKQLRESLNVRKQSKNEIINRRLNELIGKGDYLDW